MNASRTYEATERQYRTLPICRACQEANYSEAQTIEALAAEVERLTRLLIEERSAPRVIIVKRAG